MRLQKYWVRFHNVSEELYHKQLNDLIAVQIEEDTEPQLLNEPRAYVIWERIRGRDNMNVLVTTNALYFAMNLIVEASKRTSTHGIFEATTHEFTELPIDAYARWEFKKEL